MNQREAVFTLYAPWLNSTTMLAVGDEVQDKPHVPKSSRTDARSPKGVAR